METFEGHNLQMEKLIEAQKYAGLLFCIKIIIKGCSAQNDYLFVVKHNTDKKAMN